jgi:hypothetical protein
MPKVTARMNDSRINIRAGNPGPFFHFMDVKILCVAKFSPGNGFKVEQVQRFTVQRLKTLTLKPESLNLEP